MRRWWNSLPWEDKDSWFLVVALAGVLLLLVTPL